MSGILHPTGSAGSVYYNGGDFGANGADGSKDLKTRAGLFALSGVDPRLTGEQRLDQRYQDYQYGPTPEYATEQNAAMQQAGTAAQQTLSGYSQTASGRGDQAWTRTTPTTDYADANGALRGVSGSQNQMGSVATDQGDLYNRLTAYAEQGPGPSQAQAQLDASSAASMRQQLALAGSGRGAGGAASAYRNAAAQQALIQGQTNAQAAVLRAQEEDAWRGRQLQAYGAGGEVLNQEGGVLNEQGQLGLGLGQQYASQSQFLTSAELEAQAQRDTAALGFGQQAASDTSAATAAQLAYEQEGRANLENEAQANQGYETNLTELATGQMGLTNSREQRDADRSGQWIGAALGGAAMVGGAALMMSDEEEKRRIQSADDLNERYAALNDDDFTSAGWHQPGTAGYAQAQQQDEARNAEIDRLKREREERDRNDKQRKWGNIQSLMGAVSSPFMKG